MLRPWFCNFVAHLQIVGPRTSQRSKRGIDSCLKQLHAQGQDLRRHTLRRSERCRQNALADVCAQARSLSCCSLQLFPASPALRYVGFGFEHIDVVPRPFTLPPSNALENTACNLRGDRAELACACTRGPQLEAHAAVRDAPNDGDCNIFIFAGNGR
jgi:hypothetical protein